VVSAPFTGELRSWIRRSFPGEYLIIFAVALAVSVAAAVAIAIVRIRGRRMARYSCLALALLLALAYAWHARTGNAESDAVERFHFVEYGVVTYLFYRAWRSLDDGAVFVLPVLAGLIVGTAEEWFQWFIPARVGELRDIFLNAAAIVSGLLFSAGVEPPDRVSPRLRPGSLRRIGAVAALLVLALAGFINSVHLGYMVTDRVAVSFWSIFTGDELLSLGAERAREWAASPPLTRPARLSREDQYASEGLLHVQARNRAWEAGDIRSAWGENLILEEYFAPVLDTPSYVSKAGHRWPAVQRADAKGRAGAPSSMFRSGATGDFPTFTWPRPIFWTIAVTLAVAIVALTRALDRSKSNWPLPARG
jgi:VanZ family protein